jgi:hypothetical protein
MTTKNHLYSVDSNQALATTAYTTKNQSPTPFTTINALGSHKRQKVTAAISATPAAAQSSALDLVPPPQRQLLALIV